MNQIQKPKSAEVKLTEELRHDVRRETNNGNNSLKGVFKNLAIVEP